MPRRGKAPHRPVIADAKYNSRNVTRIVSRIMYDGKRSLAERIVYDALDLIEQRARRNPLDVFEQAIKNSASYDAEMTARLFCTVVNRFRAVYDGR